MRVVLFVFAAAAVLTLTHAPRAAAPTPSAIEGRTRSAACPVCHDGAGDAPNLAGQREKYLFRQLTAFKKGDRKHDSMNAIAAQLSDSDIANVAAYWSGLAPTGAPTSGDVAAKARASHMAFPSDFPSGYTLYKTLSYPDDAAVQKNYANAIAVAAARAGTPLPSGSIIFTVNYSAKLDGTMAPVLDAAGEFVPDKVQSYSGMEARAGWGNDVPELLRNADWNYGLFTADRRARPLNQAVCLACHKPVAKDSYVFTHALIAKATAK
jgi:cytochrome c553